VGYLIENVHLDIIVTQTSSYAMNNNVACRNGHGVVDNESNSNSSSSNNSSSNNNDLHVPDMIIKKRNGGELDRDEIERFVNGVVRREVQDAQLGKYACAVIMPPYVLVKYIMFVYNVIMKDC
jgi:hypothetical protein